jgi:hypothetical protein
MAKGAGRNGGFANTQEFRFLCSEFRSLIFDGGKRGGSSREEIQKGNNAARVRLRWCFYLQLCFVC